MANQSQISHIANVFTLVVLKVHYIVPERCAILC